MALRELARRYRVAIALAVTLGVKQVVLLLLIWNGRSEVSLARIAIPCVSIVLAVLVCQLRGRLQAIGAVVIDLVVSVLLLADTLTFIQFHDIVSFEEMRYAHQLIDVSSAVVSLVRPVQLLLFVDVPVLAWVAFRKGNSARLVPARGPALACAALAAAVLVVLVWVDDRQATQWAGYTRLARRNGPLTFHAMNVAEYALKRLRRPHGTDADVELLRVALARHERSGGGDRPQLHAPNILVVQVESLQSLVLDRKVGGVPVAPNLEALRAESVSFDAFYHQAGEARTADADAAVNCSVYPLAHGAIYYEYGENAFRCLPRLLTEHRYHAVAMQACWADFWNLRSVYPRLGFERFLARREWVEDEVMGMGVSDRSFLRQVAERLRQEPEPFYAFIVTLTSHEPFTFAPSSLPLGSLAHTRMGDYLDSIHYTDAALGEFVARLRASGLLDRSVLVVYGDHDGIGRRNAIGVAGMPTATDARAWFEIERRVPLLVRFPHGEHASRRTDPAGQVDIAPTLAALVGAPRSEATFFGRDLFDGERRAAVFFPDGSALDDTRLSMPQDTGVSCFDRATGAAQPAALCEDLGQRARTEVSLSRRLVERDLAARVVDRRNGRLAHR